MAIKILSNIVAGLAIAWFFYAIFYFRVVPRLIAHYRKATRAGRKYEDEIDRINNQ